MAFNRWYNRDFKGKLDNEINFCIKQLTNQRQIIVANKCYTIHISFFFIDCCLSNERPNKLFLFRISFDFHFQLITSLVFILLRAILLIFTSFFVVVVVSFLQSTCDCKFHSFLNNVERYRWINKKENVKSRFIHNSKKRTSYYYSILSFVCSASIERIVHRTQFYTLCTHWVMGWQWMR